MARLDAIEVGRRLRQSLSPDWGVEGPLQWGTVAALTGGTVSVYLDNRSSGDGATVTAGLSVLVGYAPQVGDAVLIARMQGAARTTRVVLGPLASAAFGFTRGGHLIAVGPTPTLGALQAGIASQSVSGNDTRHQFTITTTATPPAGAALIALLNFAVAYAAPPAVFVAMENQPSLPGPTGISASGYGLYSNQGLGASITYIFNAFVIG